MLLTGLFGPGVRVVHRARARQRPSLRLWRASASRCPRGAQSDLGELWSSPPSIARQGLLRLAFAAAASVGLRGVNDRLLEATPWLRVVEERSTDRPGARNGRQHRCRSSRMTPVLGRGACRRKIGRSRLGLGRRRRALGPRRRSCGIRRPTCGEATGPRWNLPSFRDRLITDVAGRTTSGLHAPQADRRRRPGRVANGAWRARVAAGATAATGSR